MGNAKLTLLACLFACQLALLCVAGEPTVELHLWNVPDRSATDPVYVARRKVFEAFLNAHPHIRVKALVPLKIQGPAQQGQEFLAVAGGVAPDVFDIEGRKVADYANQGFLHPLNENLLADQRVGGEPYSGIGAPEAIWRATVRDGKVLCVPSVWSAMQLDVRSDFFAAAGMDPLRGPRDWDELFQYAMRLTQLPSHEPDMSPDDQPVYGIHIVSGTSAGWRFAQYVYAANGDVLRPYKKIPGKPNSESPDPSQPDLWPSEARTADFASLGIRPLGAQADDRQVDRVTAVEETEWKLVTHEPAGVEAISFLRKLMQTRWMRCDNTPWHAEANARDIGLHPELKGWGQPHPREFVLSREVLESGQAVCPECSRSFDLNDRDVSRRVYRGVAYIDGQTSSLWSRPYAMRIMNLEEVNTNGSADFSESFEVPAGVMVQHPFPPRLKDQPGATQVTGRYLGINAAIETSSQPGRGDAAAIRRAAWDYIRFVTGPESQRIRVASYVESGLGHLVRPDLLLSSGYRDLYDELPERQKQMYDRVIRTAKPDSYCNGSQIITTRELNMPIQEIINDPSMQKDCAAMMSALSHRVNENVLKRQPARERGSGPGWGWIGVIVLGVTVVVVIAKVVRVAGAGVVAASQLPAAGVAIRRHTLAWAFLASAVLLVLLWQYYPLMRGMVMAFQDYKILLGHRSEWVGFDHFVRLLSQPAFYRYCLQTLLYVALSIGIGFFIPLILAVMLTEIPAGRGIFRTLYYLPAVTSSLVTLFLWKELLLSPTEQGVLNHLIAVVNNWPTPLAICTKVGGMLLWLGILLMLIRIPIRRSISDWWQRLAWSLPAVGYIALSVYLIGSIDVSALGRFFSTRWDIPTQGFLLDPSLAMLWIVIPTIWAGAGPGCLIYLAAMKTIPDEQYEAADLDGAGLWDKVIHVMMPNLKALIVINLVGAVIGAFQASDNILVMTGGGPIDRTETLGLHIWFQSFLYLNFGYATAAAWVLGAMVIGMTLVQLKTLKRVQFQTAVTRGK